MSPSFSHSSYVLQAIASVLDQDWLDIDPIVIDHGSKDNNPRIIADYLAYRGSFRFVARENRGHMPACLR